MVNNNLLGDFSPPTPLKNDGVKVSWVDEIPNWMEQKKSCSSHHQPEEIQSAEPEGWETTGQARVSIGTLGKMDLIENRVPPLYPIPSTV